MDNNVNKKFQLLLNMEINLEIIFTLSAFYKSTFTKSSLINFSRTQSDKTSSQIFKTDSNLFVEFF